MVLPSTLINIMFVFYKHVFKHRLGADAEKLWKFWADFFAMPIKREWASTNRYPCGDGDWSSTVPLTAHEDAGPCTQSKSANCLSWSGLHGVGTEKLTKHLICSNIKVAGKHDTNALRRLLVDFEESANGIYLGDHMWRFVLMFAKADEETHVNAWGLPSYNADNEVCSEVLRIWWKGRTPT